MLIIDDDESICKTLRIIFEKHGYRVDVAHTGKEAIKMTKKKFYNAAFIDIRLPDIKGVDLLPQLEDKHSKMVKIIITGYASLDNAVEALHQGGKLTVSTRVKGRFIELKINDTGVGISEDYLKKLFTPFFTTKAKGMGLGLANAKTVIESHGGTIKIESDLKEGTAVTVRIPINSDTRN